MPSKLEGHILVSHLNILSTLKNRWKDNGCKAILQSTSKIQKDHQKLVNKNKAIVKCLKKTTMLSSIIIW